MFAAAMGFLAGTEEKRRWVGGGLKPPPTYILNEMLGVILGVVA